MMESLHRMPAVVAKELLCDATNASYCQHYPQPTLSHHGASWSAHLARSEPSHRQQPASGHTAGVVGPAANLSDHQHHPGSSDDRHPQDGPEGSQEGGRNENTSPKHTEEWGASSMDKRQESDSCSEPESKASPKETQVVATLRWLSENYELSEGVCLPRCVLYVHYLDLCKRHGFKPAGAATFGKLIRQKFKNITTRRLGTRGQSKYHYYGIGIKESSVYYQAVYTGKGLTRFSGVKIKTEGSCRKYSLSSKTGTLLPDFPDADNLMLPDSASTDKMNTFIMMYRTHSQRILDTVITGNFEEIQNLLIHFWQGYPQHLQDILQLPVTCDVVAICDSILYKNIAVNTSIFQLLLMFLVLLDVLVPNAIQDLPDSLSSDLRVFLKSLPHWMSNSLDELIPENVRKVKGEVLQQFIRSLTRQLSFIKMAQTARPQMTSAEVTNRAAADLDQIDFDQMCVQTSFAVNDMSLVNCDKATAVFEEIKNLLRKQSQVETFTEWIDSLIDKCVLQSSDVAETKFQERAGRLLLQWSMFGALIMKDLTLNSARSFSFLHVLKMTLDEYILLVVETQTDKHKDVQLQRNLQKHMKNTEEIKMNAKIRTQANKIQTSPKARKRKIPAPPESEDELEATDSEEHCTSFTHDLPPAHYESLTSTAFSRPLPSQPAPRDTLDINGVSSSLSTQCGHMLRTPAFNSNPLALSPAKQFPPYDRSPYIPTFSFNAYNDYVKHANTFAPPRPGQTFPDHHTASQAFHSVNFNSAVNPAPAGPPSYWAETRPHHTGPSDPYSQLGYTNYPQTYDTYKKNTYLRSSMYQDSLSRSSSTFDGLSRANAALDGLSRTGSTLDSFARPGPSFDAGRSAMYYTPDTIQVASSLTVGPYGNSFMEITPSSGQYPRQDGLFYQEDMLASNMAAATGLSGFSKSYLPAGFR